MTKRWRLFIYSIAVALVQPATVQAQTRSMTFVMENFPPFIVDEHGQGVGPFPDVVRTVCDSMKIRCTFKLLPWRRAFAMAEAGSVLRCRCGRCNQHGHCQQLRNDEYGTSHIKTPVIDRRMLHVVTPLLHFAPTRLEVRL